MSLVHTCHLLYLSVICCILVTTQFYNVSSTDKMFIYNVLSYDNEFEFQNNHLGPFILSGTDYCAGQNLMDMQNIEFFCSDIVYRSNNNIFHIS